MDLSVVAFYAFSLILIVSAVLMVASTNIVHSALYLVVTFLSIACIYILLYADFLAVVQILVYVGAISVLLVFGVMLTRRGDIRKSNSFNRYKLSAGIIVLFFFLLVVRFIMISNFSIKSAFPFQNTVVGIATLMLNDFILPFEIAGILLLVALVGAITIGKGVIKLK